MAMQLLEPFAVDGLREDFDINPSPVNDMSINKGFTPLFQIRPEEGGKFIDMLKFNQLLYLMSKSNVEFTTQSFPNWIDDKGDGTPFAYPKNALVKYTDGNIYVSLIDNNTSIPTDTNNWVNFEDFGSLNINGLTEKITPIDTDNLALQEAGGLLKKVSFENLTKLSPNDSRVKTALNATGEAPIYACRAWVNFNGTGTVAIGASGNVSSITDNGVGDYTANFTTAMPDINYSIGGSISFDTIDNSVYSFRPNLMSQVLTTSVRMISTADNGPTSIRADAPFASISIFR